MIHEQAALNPKTWVETASIPEALDRNAGYRFGLVSRAAATGPDLSVAGSGDESCVQITAALADGQADAETISKRTGIVEHALWPLLEELHEQATIEVVSAQTLPPGPYFRHARSLALRICTAIGVPETRRLIAENDHDPALRLGAYLEEYHYIRAAPSYLSRTVAAGVTDRQVRILARYFADEYWHDRWVRTGLIEAGIPEQDLEQTHPLPSTLALINLLRWLATAELPALCVCLGATEGTPASLPDIEREFESLRRAKLLPEEAYAPFEKHARIDAEQDHGSVFGEAFLEFGPITPHQRTAIRNAVWQYWYAYLGYHQGILGHYRGQRALRLFRFP